MQLLKSEKEGDLSREEENELKLKNVLSSIKAKTAEQRAINAYYTTENAEEELRKVFFYNLFFLFLSIFDFTYTIRYLTSHCNYYYISTILLFSVFYCFYYNIKNSCYIFKFLIKFFLYNNDI